MAFNLKNRNFLKLLDFSPKEIQFLLDLAVDLKKASYAGTEQRMLAGKKNCADIRKVFDTNSMSL
jgi:ornithine carbamoyltransferase